MRPEQENFERRLILNLLKRHNKQHGARIDALVTSKVPAAVGLTDRVMKNQIIIDRNNNAIKQIDTMPLNKLQALASDNMSILKSAGYGPLGYENTFLK